MAQDLRSYLDQLVKHDPRQLKIVEEEVDPEFEAAAIVHKMEKDSAYPGFPAVLFKNVKGSPIPCLLNLHATYERVAFAIGTDVHNMVPEYGKREGSPIPTTLVPSEKAPVHEIKPTVDTAPGEALCHRLEIEHMFDSRPWDGSLARWTMGGKSLDIRPDT